MASALGGATPGLAQDVGVFGEGPTRICNTVIDSAANPVLETNAGSAVRQNGTFDCPEEEQMAAVVEPAAPPPLPDDGEVLFDLNKYNLTPDAQARINDMIFDIKDRELQGIRVVGHTDTSCPPGDTHAACEAFNQALSEKRAGTVGQALVQQGVPVGLITTEGVGMNDLAVQTPPRTVNQANRRAQIQFE
ncbi:MAG TPA: OmpA family protein [Geminicoccaceae bacterium]|nr:OmpA family protein [Geminicoccaceae bacterium]